MNKKLKLFGLLALTLALGAGVAWGFGMFTIATTDNTGRTTTGVVSSVLVGTGTKGVVAGALTFAAPGHTIQLKSATKDDILTVAPAAGLETNEATAAPNTGGQFIVNYDADLTSELGKVVMKAGNADNPDAANSNIFGGGTVLMGGTLGLTRSNAIGQGWLAIMGRAKDKAPVLRGEGVDSLIFGHTDPSGRKVAGRQPLYLLAGAVVDAGPALNELRYAVVDSTPNSSSGTLQGLEFRDGLAQLDAAAFGPVPAAVINPTGVSATRFVRLVKTGNGMMKIYGSAQAADLAANGTPATNISDAGANQHFALDGAFHRGGTTVMDGTLQMIAGVGTVGGDHFRGSLGKTWNNAGYQGSSYGYANRASFVGNHADSYNPLRVEEKGKVIVDRSQFFDDFNIVKGGVFEANDYLIAGGKFYPQIAVRLHEKDSNVDGLLKGNFDLVLDSSAAGVLRPADDGKDPGIAVPQQAVLYINGENEIGGNGAGVSGDTLVSTGVLQIAKAKSIGAGEVTIGAVAAADHGFVTTTVGVFAAGDDFDLPNVTRGRALGAAGAVTGKTLTFKDISLMNRGLRQVQDTFRINPRYVDLGENYAASDAGGEPFLAGPNNDNAFHNYWTGTVAFGGDGSWDVVGVGSNPTRVDVEQGVWRLDSYPQPTTLTSNTKPFMHVFVWPEAALSLADGVRDFNTDEAHRMHLRVTDDSRIRLVLNDSDIAATRAEAMAKAPVFQAVEINYAGLGAGEKDRDRRLVIQLDTSKLTNPKSIPAGWIKAVFSENAPQWNRLHFLRENSNVQHEDYAKVRVAWSNTSDLPEGTKAVAHLDENSNTILIEFGADVNDPVNPGTPPAPEKDLKATVTAPAEVKLGTDVTFELGKWTYKASADVEVQDVKWMLDGVDKTADVKDSKLTVKAEKEGTMNLVVTAKLKADPTVDGEAKASVAVKKDGGSSSSGGSSGGCDAGFAGLGLLLAAPLFLRKRD